MRDQHLYCSYSVNNLYTITK